MHRSLALLVFFLTLASCLRPYYDSPPCVNVPETWRMDFDEGSTLCNLRWWEQFHDPVLNQLIITALKNNQDLQVAVNRVIEFYDQYRVVSSALLPLVTGTASFNRVENSLVGPIPPTTGVPRITNDYQAFLNLSWELDFWGRVRSASDAAYAQMLSQIEARRAVVVKVVSSVANAYITLRALDGQLEVSKKTLESRIESLNLAQSRFELGETSELEVIQAKAEAEIAIISMIQFQRAIPIQENLISILLGESPRAIERGIAIQAFQYPANIPAGIPSDLLLRRPDILEAEDNLFATNALVSEARALFFPQINLTSMYGSESQKLHNLLISPAEMWQYGITAVQTLFDAGSIYYQFEEAKAVRQEAYFAYYQTILNAFREVEDGLDSYQKDRELVAEHQRQVKILSDYLYLAQLRYNEGEIDYLNVLDAERSLFDAQLALVQAQADSFTSVVGLYSALGGGWVLDADNQALDEVAIKIAENR